MTVLTIVGLVVGIGGLVAGAEVLVRGAARIAARTGMSNVVIGLTVVAFGTSAPELAVSVGDAVRGSESAGEIAIGNVVGSNIANILLALGISALLGGALVVANRIVRTDVPVMITVSVLLWVLVLDEQLGRWEGILLTGLLVVYITWTVVAARRESTAAPVTELDDEFSEAALRRHSLRGDLLLVAGGLVLLVVGSQMLVSSASDIATEFGVSDLVIGLTVVAVGTSLPEVATSLVAAVRGQRDLAVGNAVGSNLFNILAVLGITATVSPAALPVAPSAIQVDIPVMVAVAFACLPIFASGHQLARWEGGVFVALYTAYIIWLVLDASEHHIRDSYRGVMLYFVLPIVAVTVAIVTFRVVRAERGGFAGS